MSWLRAVRSQIAPAASPRRRRRWAPVDRALVHVARGRIGLDACAGPRRTAIARPGKPTASPVRCIGRGEPRGRRRARGARARRREPLSGGRRARGEARGRRPGAVPADARRQGRQGLRAAEASLDGRRRRAARARATRSTAATRGSRASGGCCAGTSIDELPQLWNVVRGDMSVIGPRPTLRYQVERYTERQRRRLEVRPGLTGWAQIHGRATLPWAERIELDVWYVEHRSPRVDLKILLRTPLALLRRHVQGRDRRMARGANDRAACGPARARRRARPGPRPVRRRVRLVARRTTTPTELALTRRCLEREKGSSVGPRPATRVAASAAAARSGRSSKEGSSRSASRRARPRSNGSAPPTRPAIRARGSTSTAGTSRSGCRQPSPTQRQVTYDCAY